MTTYTRDELQDITERANTYIREEFGLYRIELGSLPMVTPGMVRAVLAVLPASPCPDADPEPRVDAPQKSVEKTSHAPVKRRTTNYANRYNLTDDDLHAAAIAEIRRIATANGNVWCSMADFDKARQGLPTNARVRNQLGVRWSELVAEALGSSRPSDGVPARKGDGTEADPPAAGDPFRADAAAVPSDGPHRNSGGPR